MEPKRSRRPIVAIGRRRAYELLLFILLGATLLIYAFMASEHERKAMRLSRVLSMGFGSGDSPPGGGFAEA